MSFFLPLPLGPEEPKPLPLPFFPARVAEPAPSPAEEARAAAWRSERRSGVVVLVALGVVAALRPKRRLLLALGVVSAKEVEPGVGRGDVRRQSE